VYVAQIQEERASYTLMGRDSSVSLTTGYGLDGPGIESRWGRDFLHPSRPALGPTQTGPGAHPASRAMGTGSFPGVKSGRGVTLTPHLILVPLVMKECSYTSTPTIGRTACTEPQCLYKDALYLYLTLHFIQSKQAHHFT